MKVNKFVIAAGLVIAAYIAYRWYTGRQSNALGANLNSVAPELIGGSTGPSSGLTYNAGSTTINLSETPVTQPQVNVPPPVKFRIFRPIGG